MAVKTFMTLFLSTSVKVSARLLDASYSREYVFFDGHTTPYLAHKVNVGAPGAPTVTWTYNLDTNILTRGADLPLRNLPWLSAFISYNRMKLYTLDEFVESVKFATSGEEPPPPAVVIGAWSLYTGFVLDTKLNLELTVINDEGDTVVFSPWDFENTPHAVPLSLDNLYIESTGGVRRVSEMLDDEMPALMTT